MSRRFRSTLHFVRASCCNPARLAASSGLRGYISLASMENVECCRFHPLRKCETDGFRKHFVAGPEGVVQQVFGFGYGGEFACSVDRIKHLLFTSSSSSSWLMPSTSSTPFLTAMVTGLPSRVWPVNVRPGLQQGQGSRSSAMMCGIRQDAPSSLQSATAVTPRRVSCSCSIRRR